MNVIKKQKWELKFLKFMNIVEFIFKFQLFKYIMNLS